MQKPFMDENFLLSTATAQELYHSYAAQLPILDYHSHVSAQEIYQDREFANISQIWLGADHYKWRLLRANGVDEYYITGAASEQEKFKKFAEMLPLAIGNPMYHWCHLELQRYFGYTGTLQADTWAEVWELTERKLGAEKLSVRKLLAQSKVEFVGTTDDPLDSLCWHEKIAADPSISTVVAPSFRPDKALNIAKSGWLEYTAKLAELTGAELSDLLSFKKALAQRMHYFAARGCKAADHGLDYVCYRKTSPIHLEAIWAKARAGGVLDLAESECFQTEMLLFCASQYASLGWVMQWHFNCLRNPNQAMFELLGADSGFDCMGGSCDGSALAALLSELFAQAALPRTILYSLNAGDNAQLDTLVGAFQGTEISGKIQHGSAWWFNDTKTGMLEQLTSLANLGLLGNFIGMLTDSRSFLSYTRHEYFRRILCELLGLWVENGEYPAERGQLGSLVKGICYANAKRYFKL